MPKLTIDGGATYDVPPNKRLINALSDEAGTDQLHSCVANLLPNVDRTETKGNDL
jgi:hypothetical protein